MKFVFIGIFSFFIFFLSSCATLPSKAEISKPLPINFANARILDYLKVGKNSANAQDTDKIDSIESNLDSIESNLKKNLEDEYSITTEEPDPQIIRTKIFSIFKDEFLDEILALALEKNTDLKIAASRIKQAKARLASSQGVLFPSISGNVNASTSGDSKTSENPYNIGASGNLSWELDLFGKNAANTAAQRSLYFQSIENLQNAQISLLCDVMGLYFNLLSNAENIKLSAQNVALRQEVLNLAAQKAQAGLLDSTEVFERLQRLHTEENTLSSLKVSFTENKNSLLILLDEKTLPSILQSAEISAFDLANLVPKFSDSIKFIESENYIETDTSKNATNIESSPLLAQNIIKDSMIFTFKEITTLDMPNAPASVILERPDIKAAIFALHSQIYNRASAKAALLPSISINASLSTILAASTGGVGNLAYSLASGLAAPLLNRTQITQNYFLQDELLNESYLNLAKTLNTALGEIENSIFALDSANLTLQNNKINSKTANEILDFSKNRRALGFIDDLSHFDNLASFNDSNKNLNSAYLSQYQAIITLFRAFGGAVQSPDLLNSSIFGFQSPKAARFAPHEEEALRRLSVRSENREALKSCSAVGTGAATAFAQCGTSLAANNNK